jgi:hypothetical protein
MKTFMVVLILLAASTAFANTAPNYPNQDVEMFFIGASVGVSFINVIGITTAEPSYWLGGAGIAIGATTLLLMTGEHPRYEGGLFATGAIAATTGLINILQGRVLDTRDKHARLEPSWSNGATGLAFVVDF